jgi:hypothetical protein
VHERWGESPFQQSEIAGQAKLEIKKDHVRKRVGIYPLVFL